MSKKVDWVILLEANGVTCAECGKVENNFICGYCNAQTHGMYKYGHFEFQMVLHMKPEMIMYTLNRLGFMVQSGRRFKNGDIVDDLFEGYSALLTEFTENGKTLLRVMIPDPNHKFPSDNGCMPEYAYQGLPIEDLYIGDTSHRRLN